MAKVKANKKSGHGKRAQRPLKQLKDYMKLSKRSKHRAVNMVINLWYNKEVSQWRWTLTDKLNEDWMESGNSKELEVALQDVQRTIEWLTQGTQVE